MKCQSKHSSRQRFLATIATSLLILTIFITLASSVRVANADFESLRSWVNVEIPYFGADNILVKMSVVTIGNHLNDGMWIEEVASGSTSTSGFGVTVTVGKAVIEAMYSTDSNTTEFIYIVSSSQYDIAKSGDFPYDYWRIGITFSTNFTAQFDSRMKYCSASSPYYYGEYNTTYDYLQQGFSYYTLNLEILHPSEFAGFVYEVFLPAIVFLSVLIAAIVSVAILLMVRRKDISRFENAFITIGSAVIVFIPVFQLSTQELKTPFTITWIDYSFLALLVSYIFLLVLVLVGKMRRSLFSSS